MIKWLSYLRNKYLPCIILEEDSMYYASCAVNKKILIDKCILFVLLIQLSEEKVFENGLNMCMTECYLSGLLQWFDLT